MFKPRTVFSDNGTSFINDFNRLKGMQRCIRNLDVSVSINHTFLFEFISSSFSQFWRLKESRCQISKTLFS